MGRPLIEEYITEGFKDKVQMVQMQVLDGGEEAYKFELPLTKDTRSIDNLLNATTRRYAQGQIAGVVGGAGTSPSSEGHQQVNAHRGRPV